MNCDELQQLAALRALGALPESETAVLGARLADDESARADLARFIDVAAALAGLVPQRPAPIALRQRILDRILKTPQSSGSSPARSGSAPEPFHFVDRGAPWLPTPILGIRLKVLSASPSAEYAMLLAELGPGAVYPEHEHEGVEETYVLSGDLTCQGRVMGPGDYFHAEAGTHHESLTTRDGCTAIFVVPRRAFLEFVGA
jgi:anti-sigma factor ChrR (cupin superfamily)